MSAPITSAPITTATAANRLKTSIFVIAPSMKPPSDEAPSDETVMRPPRRMFLDPGSWTFGRDAWPSAATPTGGSSADTRRDLREIPARQTTIPATSQCTLSQTPCDRLPASCRRREPAVSHPCPGHNAGILLLVDG